ncbi:MAG: hypothetical protein ACLRZ9_03640 [Eubacterium sp.]
MNEENKSKKRNTAIIIVLIIVGLVLLAAVKISVDKLTEAVINTGNDNSDDAYVKMDYSDWDNRFDELESKIDQQSSSLEDVKITLGAIDAKNGMGQIKIQVVPKEYAKNTKVTVTIGEYSTELKLKKQKFVGEIETPFREVYDFVYVAMETEGKTKSEKIVLSDDEEFCNWDSEIPYRVSGDSDSDYDIVENGNKLKIQLKDTYLEVENTEKENNLPVLYITKNNSVVFQKKMQWNADSKEYKGECTKTFDFKNGDRFKCYAEYIGKSGLKYRIDYLDIKCDEDEAESIDTEEDGSCVLYDINGKKIDFKYMDEDEESEE